MHVFIAGKSSTLVNQLFGIDFQTPDVKPSLAFTYKIIDRKEFFDLTKANVSDSAWVVVALEPRSPEIDRNIFKHALEVFETRVVLISSASALQPLMHYGYLQRKNTREAQALLFGFHVIRLGYGGQQKSWTAEIENSISRCAPISNFKLFEYGLKQIVIDETKVCDAFVMQDTSKDSFLHVCFSELYGFFSICLKENRILLRPLDIILRFLGIKGYGYSYWSKHSTEVHKALRRKVE